ncbi:MAG: replication-associated recombination protein A [bacterium]|jgi:putative ATPase|nr:replication-associated recombination protein A [bacterium]
MSRTPHPNLFHDPEERRRLAPLAERMRARRLDEVVGQPELTGPDSPLRRMLETGRLESVLFWGPPGCGKTTLARLIMDESGAETHSLNAVTSGVGELRKVFEAAEAALNLHGRRSLLFIDEIHRYNKAQQDALLKTVEDGTLTLLAATTENPGFEIIPALLSRCHLLTLRPLDDVALLELAGRALERDEWLASLKAELEEAARARLCLLAGGDARRLLQLLEMAATVARPDAEGRRRIGLAELQATGQGHRLPFDKGGDQHYDQISALIKSVRGSDADAAIYWLARLLESGEEPRFIARRLLILASEDIGNAAPNGLVLANACFEAVHKLGLPEAMYPLAQCAAFLAAQPKSNACAAAILEARRVVRARGADPVPVHLRNAPTRLARELGHGADYQYPPDHEGSFARQAYLPEGLEDLRLYRPSRRGLEGKLRDYLASCWPERFASGSLEHSAAEGE